MLDKTFDAASVEPRIYDAWEQAGAFKAGAGKKDGQDSFCIVIPPPNVTGSLHMGHALNNTLQDVMCRFERMRGKDVLWQPGTDHAGIATQMVVERQLAQQNLPGRRDMGRDAFIDRVWQWKAESGGTIINQLRRLGASCDWSRERFTMDEGLSQAVLKVFVELYKDDLIYRDKRLVNWDPVFQTAISDLEVEQKEVDGHMWHFAYPLVDGPVDGIEEIVIATTRPETMLGDGAVAVHPSDERYKNLIGKMVRLPIAERHIPIIADEYPDPEFGSGAVKITGAHDFNDFEVARRHDIPLIVLMDKEARMISTPENHVPERYDGVDRFEARKMVLQEIEELGFFRGVEDKVIAQPFGDRSGVVIEPMLTDQWYVNAGELAKPAIASVREGRTEFVPKNWEKTYYDWMENIQPWCISRQLWWGHQIPAWYGPDGKVFVELNEAEAQAAADAHYGETVELVRDEDVLDTWFSSALWPFSTLGWPEKTPELDRYYQTDVLVTGFDIIFFWVARMMMMSLHFMKEEPFHTVYVHALVRDEKGAKMSKSKGNVIDPLELVDEYGADAVRFTLAAMAAQGRDIKLATGRVAGYRNFGTKLWNAARFAEMNQCVRQADFDPSSVQLTVNRWVVTEAAQMIASVSEGIETYRFNDAANGLYRFIWNIYCDWYVELIKPILNGDDEVAKAETRATSAWVLDQILVALHPFMPFMTEELWARTGNSDLVCFQSWPDVEATDDGSAEEINWLIDVITSVRSVRSEMNVPASAKVPLVFVGADELTKTRLGLHENALARLARTESVSLSSEAPEGSAQIVVGTTTVCLSLAGVIDLDAEKARLEKEIGKIEKEIVKLDGKLANEKFLSKAPAEVIQDQRDRRDESAQLLAKVKEALGRLGSAA
ncbi:valine--tRNA ligase [Coralliovum pocilloporae]|uniref:valine--tRNA ligase n=1 Tax=Coralliovum pocilloporae TaxID=3066369 RepID=UPI0033071E1B